MYYIDRHTYGLLFFKKRQILRTNFCDKSYVSLKFVICIPLLKCKIIAFIKKVKYLACKSLKRNFSSSTADVYKERLKKVDLRIYSFI